MTKHIMQLAQFVFQAWLSVPCYGIAMEQIIINKLRGRRVRPTRYAPARVQEPNFTAL